MSYYLRVLNRRKDEEEIYICSTLSEAIDALERIEIGTFVSLTTRKPKEKKKSRTERS